MATTGQVKETKTFSVRQGKEVVVRMRNLPGLLAEIAKVVSEKGVNILALNATVYGEDCVIRMITDDNLRTKDLLTARHYGPQEENVLVMDLAHRPGMLRRVTELLAKEDIDLRHAYATAAPEDERCLLVFHSSHDEHALVLLRHLESE